MIRIKKFSEKDSDDKKSNLSKPMVTKKKSPNKKVKPRNHKLEGEKHLSDELKHSIRKSKPNSKKVDGENFLSDDIKVMKFTEAFTNPEETEDKAAKNYALNKCKDNEGDLELVKSAWLDGYNTRKTAEDMHDNVEDRKTVAAQRYAIDNCKDKSKLNLIKKAWLDGFDTCDRKPRSNESVIFESSDFSDNDKIIFKLASIMLDMASDEFGNHGCNDLPERIKRIIPEFLLKEINFYNSKGKDPWPENVNQIGDCSLMGFLSSKLKEMSM